MYSYGMSHDFWLAPNTFLTRSRDSEPRTHWAVISSWRGYTTFSQQRLNYVNVNFLADRWFQRKHPQLYLLLGHNHYWLLLHSQPCVGSPEWVSQSSRLVMVVGGDGGGWVVGGGWWMCSRGWHVILVYGTVSSPCTPSHPGPGRLTKLVSRRGCFQPQRRRAFFFFFFFLENTLSIEWRVVHFIAAQSGSIHSSLSIHLLAAEIC